VDGTAVEGIPDFAKLATGSSRIKIIGRNLLLFESEKNGKTLRLYDPITAKDVWRKTYEANARIVRCYDSDAVAVLQPGGKVERMDPATGAVTFATTIDPVLFKDALAQTTSPLMLTDAERIYLVLNKSGTGGTRSNVYYGYNPIRTLPIEGPMICYSKTTGEELWATGRQFEGQQIITDRFAELPCLIAANNSYDQKTGTQTCEVIAVDKGNGKVKIKDNRLSPNGPFQSLQHDPKTGKFELIRYDTKIVITPLDPAKP
jgi:hypothetical protein